MAPRSVAILGASDNPQRIGGRALGYMLARPFGGGLLPVNPKRPQVQGIPAFARLSDLPEVPDLAIIALAAKLVPDAVGELAAMGVRGAVVFSSGFSEVDGEGAALQADIQARAKRGGMRLLGPNALGLVNPRVNLWATFTSALEGGWPETGRVGIASQSGAYGAHMLAAAMARGIGISGFVTTGNEADLTTADVIGWMADDPGTDVIMAYLEGVRDGDRLVAALERAHAARKPVIVMKAGRSQLGAAAAQSHTASLAGNDAVTDAVLREMGALRIDSTEQALDFAEAATRRIYPVANTLGVLTISGGAGILIADEAERLNLPMPAMPPDAQAAMRALLSYAATRNPVDCTAQALNQLDLVGEFGLHLVRDGGFSALLLFFSQAGAAASVVPGLRAQLRRILEAAPDRLCVLSVLGPPEVLAQYRADGFLVYEDPARAVAAIAAMGRLGAAFAAPLPAPPAITPLPAPARTPNEHEAKAILGRAGITLAREVLVTSREEAEAAARQIGLPVVMKIVSPDIVHKTEIGGVLTDISTADAAATGFDTLMHRARTARPGARLDGVLVAQKVTGGVECLMGVTRDPVFGPVAAFGLGGIHVEVLRDVVLWRCPFDAARAEALIRSIRAFALLNGVRGQPGVDIGALAQMLSRLSHLAVALGPTLRAIDINPVIATPAGAWAVDAVIEIDPQDTLTGGFDAPSALHSA